MTAPELKAEILRLTREYSAITHAAQRPGDDPVRAPFVAGETTVPYAGRVFTEDEVEAAVGATLDFWLTLGPEGEAFERELHLLTAGRASRSPRLDHLVKQAKVVTHPLIRFETSNQQPTTENSSPLPLAPGAISPPSLSTLPIT